jgi:DNA polymerase III sliding clamp (beta) subunit (PCNA family)
MMQGLPLGGDHQITFIDRGDSFIRLKSDKWVAKLHTMRAGDFPLISEFSVMGMSAADDLATKVDQVTWACDPKTDILSGVHLDGNRLVGCNRYALAVVPCSVPLADPVTVPLSSLSSILKVATEVQLRAIDRQLQISLDSETQATSRLIEGDFPPIDRIMRSNFRGSVVAARVPLVEALNRMLVLVRSERMPTMQITFDGTGLLRSMTFDMEVEQVGRMQDSVDVSGEWDDIMTMHIKPKMLVDAVDHSKADTVTLHFGNCDDPTKDSLGTLVITDDRGYQCHLSAIRQ